jgi:hypothetical protein
VRRVALLCGVVSPILWIGLIAFGDIVRPDVDAVTGFISELGERGSATELIMRWAGFGVTGLLYVCFAAALPSAAGTGRWRILLVALFVAVDGIGRVGAAVYPCDPGCQGTSRDQQLHRLFATIAFCSGILAALADGVLFRRGFAAAMGLSAMISRPRPQGRAAGLGSVAAAQLQPPAGVCGGDRRRGQTRDPGPPPRRGGDADAAAAGTHAEARRSMTAALHDAVRG